MAEDSQQPAARDTPERLFKAKKFYLKDVSFESPNSPAVFKDEWQPQHDFELASDAREIKGDNYEVIVHLTVTVKSGDMTAYLVEVHQAGIFTLKGMTREELDIAHNVHCLKMLYPYASATLTELVVKGGFPQLLLTPMDFEALYVQSRQAAAAQESTETG